MECQYLFSRPHQECNDSQRKNKSGIKCPSQHSANTPVLDRRRHGKRLCKKIAQAESLHLYHQLDIDNEKNENAFSEIQTGSKPENIETPSRPCLLSSNSFAFNDKGTLSVSLFYKSSLIIYVMVTGHMIATYLQDSDIVLVTFFLSNTTCKLIPIPSL